MKRPTVLEHIRMLIESKIQFTDFQTTLLLKKLTDVENKESQVKNVEEFIDFLDAANLSVEEFLNCIENYSASKKRLLMLRSIATEQNGIQILDLLVRNDFMQNSEKELLKQFAPQKMMGSAA